MIDVLFLTMLRSLEAGDPDTADECVSLASDPEAVSALLDDDDLAESYTESQYATLSEAGRAGLVKRTGTDSNGRKYTRWVRVVAAKPDKAAVKATAKDTASRLVRDGVRTPQQARQLADSLKQMSGAEIDQLKREFQARTGGRLKQEKVARLVAYAQGRGSVTAAPTTVKPAGTPTTADMEAAIVGEVEKGLSGPHAGRRMVPIHEIRAALKATTPGMTDDQFNTVLLDMRRSKKVKLVSIDDRSRATAQQLKDSVFAVGETFFYVERV